MACLRVILAFIAGCVIPYISHAGELAAQLSNLGSWPGYSRGPGLKIRIVSDTAYVAAGNAGLVIWDISDLSNPIRIGGVDTLGSVGSVAIGGNHAYAIDSEEGFISIDVSDPAHPLRVGSYRTAGAGGLVAVSANYAYVACGPTRTGSELPSEGFLVLDVSDPRFPKPVINIPFPDLPPYGVNPADLQIAGNRAFVATYNAGMFAYDISNPLAARSVWSNEFNSSAIPALGTANGNLLISRPGSLQVFDTLNGQQPTLLGSMLLSQNVIGIEGRANTVFTVGPGSFQSPITNWGLRVLDLTDPKSPVEIGANSIYERFLSIALHRDSALMADSLGGLHISDVVVPANPIYKGRSSLGGYARHVEVADGYAYMADANFEVIDIADPAHPRWVNSLESATSIAVAGNIACTVEGLTLRVIDISDKTNFKTLGSYTNSTDVDAAYSQVIISGSRAFARGYVNLEGVGGPFVHVFDLSQPDKPIRSGFIRWYYDGPIIVTNDILYSESYGSLNIFDITDPANLVRLGSFSGDYLSGIVLQGNYLFGAGQNGFQVLDVTDPKNVVSVGKCPLPGPVANVRVSGNYVYLSGGAEIYVLDVTDLTKPTLIGSYRDEGEPLEVAIAGEYLVVADGSAGLRILKQRFGAAQSIIFPVPKQIPLGESVALNATADTGLPVSYSIVSGPALLNGSLLTITGPGEVRVRAQQTGNNATLPAFAEATINSPPVPNLQTHFDSSTIELTWSGRDESIKVEMSNVLGVATWREMVIPIQRSESQTFVKLPTAQQTSFYRLRRD